MKYAIIIPDGCADEPLKALQGRTPLQAAQLPAMDALAAAGQVGLSNNTPAHLPAGSEVANLSLLGYDPDQYFTGRAPLEAAAQGISLGPHDWAIRCNLVTIAEQVMVDFTADHISTAEATELLAVAQSELAAAWPGPGTFRFIPGVSYRNLLIYRGTDADPPPFSQETRTTAPHDLTDLAINDDFPRGPGSWLLQQWMDASGELFRDLPVNQRRRQQGHRDATHLWLWGLGRTPQLPSFHSRFGVQGAMITAVDLLRGIAALVGWPRIEVPGATGYLDTDYAAKGAHAIAALESHDLICVHIEAPDEASHEGRHDAKISALEEIDRHIVAPLHRALADHGPYRILVSPDHPTPCSTKKHSHGMVPFLIAGSDLPADAASRYDEVSAAETGLRLEEGWDLMDLFFK